MMTDKNTLILSNIKKVKLFVSISNHILHGIAKPQEAFSRYVIDDWCSKKHTIYLQLIFSEAFLVNSQ